MEPCRCPRRLAFLLRSCVFLFCIGSVGFLAEGAQAANESDVVIVAIENQVTVTRAGSNVPQPARTNDVLRTGDRITVGKESRASIRLRDLTIARLGSGANIEIAPPVRAASTFTLRILRGLAYFFGRGKPQEMDLQTPIATAGTLGTEFNVFVADDDTTTFSMVEGRVALTANGETIQLADLEEGFVQRGQPPKKRSVLNATNVVQWALYYPGVLDTDELALSPAEQQPITESLAAWRSGDVLAALAAYPADRRPDSDRERVYRAALLLSVGDVENAESLLNRIRPANSRERTARLASALRQLIAAVKFEMQPAHLIFGAPEPALLATEWLAESYYQQSRSDLRLALKAARNSVSVSTNFGFGWAQVAELEFSFGRTDHALVALERSLEHSPRNAQALALKGFLLAAQGKISAAAEWFERALAIDSAVGNAWLGLGLCKIHQGRAEEGRRDLQMAAAMEPNRALLRSYLGKAFSNEGDTQHAVHELELARRFDPSDPTAPLYSALLNQERNRINEAVRDLERSQELNKNRSVYRSQLLLDQDRAVRSANLAAIYQDAGMIDVANREASRAVQTDYANYSAHLFLANSYDALRDPRQINLRYETAWLSEYLLANLLAPVGAGSLSPNISQQEYARLFERNRTGISTSTEYFSSGDWVQNSTQFGQYGNSAWALDSAYRTENGQRANNDIELWTLSLQFKQQLTPQDSVFVHGIYYTAESGDVVQYYDQTDANRELRVRERQEPLLLAGYHHEWAPGVHSIVLGGWLTDSLRNADPAGQALLGTVSSAQFSPLTNIDVANRYRGDLEIYTAEFQQIFQQEKQGIILGARFQTGDFDTHSRQLRHDSNLPFLFPTSGVITNQDITTDFQRISLYGYYNRQIFEPLLLTVGVSYDRVDYPENFRHPPINDNEQRKDRVSPKAGLIWTPDQDTTVRATYTRSLGGVSFDQSFRLEPTQISGFNQSFRSLVPEALAGSVAAETFETAGAGVDRKFKTGTYAGLEAEWLQSEANQVLSAYSAHFAPPFVSAFNLREQLEYTEGSIAANLNQLVGECWTFGARYRVSQAELEVRHPNIPAAFTSASIDLKAILQQLDCYVLFHHRCGFFARADAVWTHQTNEEDASNLADEDVWQLHLFAGYRFPRRRAEIRLGLLNVTDQDYRLNPVNLYAELPRERTFTASLRFNF